MNRIEFIHASRGVNINTFPFDSIKKMIQSTNYHTPILRYADYYYRHLQTMRDEIFGCLNPLLITILHGDSKLLNSILERHGYPLEFALSETPIEFSFRQHQLSCLETLCKFLIRKGLVNQIWFTLSEFRILLRSGLVVCHEVLGQILTVRPDMRFPALAHMAHDCQIEAKSTLMKFLLKLQKGGRPPTEEDLTVEPRDSLQSKRRTQWLEKRLEAPRKSEVDILTVPFKYDYTSGSEDSVNFLSFYSKSASDRFVRSEWQQVIDQKWVSVRLFNMFLALYFFGFLAFTTVVVVIEEGNVYYANSLMFIISLFMVLEVLQIVSYTGFDLKSYILDIWNIIDWTLFITTILYPSTLQKDSNKEGSLNKVGGVVILVLTYYRGFSYLRTLNYFTWLVEIINSVISRPLSNRRKGLPVPGHSGLLVLPHGHSLPQAGQARELPGPLQAGLLLRLVRQHRHDRLRIQVQLYRGDHR